MNEKNENMLKIKAIENEYGLVLFRMGLTHLFDVGVRHMTDETVTETIKHIKAKEDKDKEDGVTQVMTPEFQCEIVQCAAALSKFSIWDLFLYIKKYVTIS